MADSTHECPRDGCVRRVPRERLACPRHWAAVRPYTKSLVYAAYRDGDIAAHAAAMREAIQEMNTAPL